jgi:hypothetical protein
MRQLGLGKLDNEYATAVRDIDASKTVWMALAFSFAQRLSDDDPVKARFLLMDEWAKLHDNGIVPQRPRMS